MTSTSLSEFNDLTLDETKTRLKDKKINLALGTGLTLGGAALSFTTLPIVAAGFLAAATATRIIAHRTKKDIKDITQKIEQVGPDVLVADFDGVFSARRRQDGDQAPASPPKSKRAPFR